jgi:hypothetical protein
MKKVELLKILSQYDDAQEIFVEAKDGGFDDPVVYVSALRVRSGKEHIGATDSEYLNDRRSSGRGAVAVVLGTSVGFLMLG